jgi:hypothetical protein
VAAAPVISGVAASNEEDSDETPCATADESCVRLSEHRRSPRPSRPSSISASQIPRAAFVPHRLVFGGRSFGVSYQGMNPGRSLYDVNRKLVTGGNVTP